MIRRIALVARQGAVAHVRERAWYAVAASVALLAATAAVAGPLSAGEEVKVVKDLGLALVELAGVLTAALIGVGLIAREVERRSILSLLAKPLPRWEFVVGQYLGLLVTIVAGVALLGLALWAVLAFTGGSDPHLVVALVMIAAELALVAAVALFFSSFSSSAVVSTVLTAGVFVAGQLSADLRSFKDVAGVSGWVAHVAAAIGWALPDFSRFDVKGPVVHGEPVARGLVALALVYGVLYTTALVAGAVALFSRRELR